MIKLKGGAIYYETDLTNTIIIDGNKVILDKEETGEGLKDQISLEYILQKDAILVNGIIYDIKSLFDYIMSQIIDSVNKSLRVGYQPEDIYRRDISNNDVIKIILKFLGFSNISAFSYVCKYGTTEIPGLRQYNLDKMTLYPYVIKLFYEASVRDNNLFYKTTYEEADLANIITIEQTEYIKDKIQPDYPLMDIVSVEPIKRIDAYLLYDILYNINEVFRYIINQIIDRTNNSLRRGYKVKDIYKRDISYNDIIKIILNVSGFSNISALSYVCKYGNTDITAFANFDVNKKILYDYLKYVFNNIHRLDKDLFYKTTYEEADLANIITIEQTEYIKDKIQPDYPLMDIVSVEPIKKKDAILVNGIIYDINSLFAYIISQIIDSTNNSSRVRYKVKDIYKRDISYNDIIKIILNVSGFSNISALSYVCKYGKTNITGVAKANKEKLYDYLKYVFNNIQGLDKDLFYKTTYHEADLANIINRQHTEYIKDKIQPDYPLMDIVSFQPIKKKDAILVNGIIYDINAVFGYIISQIIDSTNNSSRVRYQVKDIYKQDISYNDIIKIILKFSGFRNISAFLCFCNYEEADVNGLAQFRLNKENLYNYITDLFYKTGGVVDTDLFYKTTYTKTDLSNIIIKAGTEYIKDKIEPDYPLIDIKTLEPIEKQYAILVNGVIYDIRNVFKHILPQILKKDNSNNFIMGKVIDIYARDISYNDIIEIILQFLGFSNISAFIYYYHYGNVSIGGLNQVYDCLLHIFFKLPGINKNLFYKATYTRNDLDNIITIDGTEYIRDKIQPDYPLIDIDSLEPIKKENAALSNKIIYSK